MVIEARGGFVPLELGELWSYRDLIAFLALRDLRSRYKQSVLGASWALLQPLGTMVAFSALFGLLLGRNALPGVAGVPYEVSTFCALVPWQLFATSLVASGNSLVQNQALLTKVYFPRLAAPIAPILAALVDFALAFAVLLGMLVWHGITPGFAVFWLPVLALLAALSALAFAVLLGMLVWHGITPGLAVFWLPGLALMAALSALAVSLWLSALNALYRDVRHVLPFLVQLWMFATPVVYASERVLHGRPEWQQWLYGANPMVGVVEGFRFALLGTPPPGVPLLCASALSISLLLVGGAFFFRRMEQRFADRV